MIVGIIHPGSGLGDQLFSYITTRTIALDRGFDFGFVDKEFFKGKDFMQLDWGFNLTNDMLFAFGLDSKTGAIQLAYSHKEWKAPAYYDPEVNFIDDGTVIDATCAQNERYWDIEKVRQWIITKVLEMPDEKCVINFRGGEFSMFPELFLTKEYWEKGINLMKDKYPNIKFEIHTDDEALAANFFKDLLVDFRVIKGIEDNWKAVRYAKHLILSNSAFGIIPALLNENVKEIIAPRFWARRNIGQWSMPSNYYKKFLYI